MNPFKSQGFDSLIAKGLKIEGHMTLAPDTTTQIDGEMSGETISMTDAPAGKGTKTTLVVNGSVKTIQMIIVPNVTITGEVECSALEVVGVLAIKKGAKVKCNRIRYNTLIVETGAIIHGHFEHIQTAEIPTLIDVVKP